MNRREFLKKSLAAGTAGIVGSSGLSCTSIPELLAPSETSRPLPDMDAYLATVDDGLAGISTWSLQDEIPTLKEGFERESELGRKSFKALYLTGMLGDLPLEGQAYPGMQERIRDAAPDFDEAVFDTAHYLQERSRREYRDVQRYIQRPSNPGMALAQRFDELAARAGVSTSRRLQTRSIFTQAVGHLKNDDSDLFAGECVRKVEKLAASDGYRQALHRKLADQLSREAFWKNQGRLIPITQTLGYPYEEETYAPMRKPLRGIRPLKAGLIVLGIGLVVTGVAGALYFSPEPVVFAASLIGLTVGILAIVVGLFMTIISGAIALAYNI